MNYKKIVLVGFISAFVAILTSVMGVAGTIIGSVISSVLYNMLSEALEKPMENASFDTNFEWDIAYVFPLVVIALIQLLLIFALLAEAGFLHYGFAEFYFSIQNLANNNLYKILGVALLIMSVYPLILKPEHVTKIHGIIIGFVGLVFLARGFVDIDNNITNLYDGVFSHFDFQIAVIAFILLLIVIVRIILSARNSENEFKTMKKEINNDKINNNGARMVYSSKSEDARPTQPKQKARKIKQQPVKPRRGAEKEHKVNFKNRVEDEKANSSINKSSEKIHFESNDLLEEYKK